MIRIQVRPNEPLESALRRFKRQCNYAGIFRLAKKYNFFEKKSDRERRERRERIRTMQRAQRRAMGPTKVRRTAKKSKFRKGGQTEDTEAANAKALAQKAAPANAHPRRRNRRRAVNEMSIAMHSSVPSSPPHKLESFRYHSNSAALYSQTYR